MIAIPVVFTPIVRIVLTNKLTADVAKQLVIMIQLQIMANICHYRYLKTLSN